MTEQQQHLIQLLQQRDEISKRNANDRELILKLQGAIEYLTQIGVTLPEPPTEETAETAESTEEVSTEE